jgi:hypothetical protein
VKVPKVSAQKPENWICAKVKIFRHELPNG